MNQPVPHYTQEDFERIIARDFARESVARVLEILARYGDGPVRRKPLRIWMACLKCANGSIEGLRQAVDLALRDYRDILVAAEYPEYMNARTPEEQARAIETDWIQLQAWLRRV